MPHVLHGLLLYDKGPYVTTSMHEQMCSMQLDTIIAWDHGAHLNLTHPKSIFEANCCLTYSLRYIFLSFSRFFYFYFFVYEGLVTFLIV